MGRAMAMASVPWLALLVTSFLALLLLVRLSRVRWELGRLRRIHADQVGTVQNLSFVMTLPLFVFVMMLIVQVSQLMVAQMVVEYAAVAAARAAVVWIPTRIDDVESWNCSGGYDDFDNPPSMPFSGPQPGGKTHVLSHGPPPSQKYQKIRMAAVLACLPISPSRRFPGIPAPPADMVSALADAYTAITGKCDEKARNRLANKLAYTLFQDPRDASKDTLTVDVQFYHSNKELPLACPPAFLPGQVDAGVLPDGHEFAQGRELGWQDPITVTVKYHLALLPGPGRLLATWQGRAAPVARIEGQQGNPSNVFMDTYVYSLTATATLGNEGEKPAYAHYNTSQYH
jgi:hypothetical protein